MSMSWPSALLKNEKRRITHFPDPYIIPLHLLYHIIYSQNLSIIQSLGTSCSIRDIPDGELRSITTISISTKYLVPGDPIAQVLHLFAQLANQLHLAKLSVWKLACISHC